MLAPIMLRFLAQVTMVGAQIQHFSGLLPPKHVVTAMKSYSVVTDPYNKVTLCALNTPATSVPNVPQHGDCIKNCFRRSTCISYNYRSNTSTCDLFDTLPIRHTHDNICINYKDNSVPRATDLVIDNLQFTRCFNATVASNVFLDLGIDFSTTNATSVQFAVKATGDCMMTFSPTKTLTSGNMAMVDLGGNGNTQYMAWNNPSYCCSYPTVAVSSSNILDPNNFKWFWYTWINATLSLGQGNQIGSNHILTYPLGSVVINRLAINTNFAPIYVIMPSYSYSDSSPMQIPCDPSALTAAGL